MGGVRRKGWEGGRKRAGKNSGEGYGAKAGVAGW